MNYFLSDNISSDCIIRRVTGHGSIGAFSMNCTRRGCSRLSRTRRFTGRRGIGGFSGGVATRRCFGVAPVIRCCVSRPLPGPSTVTLCFLTGLTSRRMGIILSNRNTSRLFNNCRCCQRPLSFTGCVHLPRNLHGVLNNVTRGVPSFRNGEFLAHNECPVRRHCVHGGCICGRRSISGILTGRVPSGSPTICAGPFFSRIGGRSSIAGVRCTSVHA